jgi:post-segregation antitoxin (ccd killing protein)
MRRINRKTRELRETTRRPYRFLLDAALVERAKNEVGELDVIRSIEAALAAAIDYKAWQREITSGQRDILS